MTTEERIAIKLTAKQADAVDWALPPMVDFWTTEFGADERGGAVYDESDLPTLDGLILTLSPIDEINSDLLYRVEVQLPDMCEDEKVFNRSAIGTGRASENVATKIREASPAMAALPYGGGWLVD